MNLTLRQLIMKILWVNPGFIDEIKLLSYFVVFNLIFYQFSFIVMIFFQNNLEVDYVFVEKCMNLKSLWKLILFKFIILIRYT
jgi:hypothetical protein